MSFPNSYATILRKITLTTTELHDVIQNHDYWQPRTPNVPNCVLRSAMDPRNFLYWKIIIWQNSWMRPGNIKLSNKLKILTLIHTSQEIRREWINISFRKASGTYGLKLDVVGSHKMSGLKLCAELNECNYLNSENVKSTSVSSFLCVGVM